MKGGDEMKKKALVSCAVWILSLLIILCVKAEAQEVIHLGATVPFSWRMGINLKNILEMNADLVNKSGGLTVGGKPI